MGREIRNIRQLYNRKATHSERMDWIDMLRGHGSFPLRTVLGFGRVWVHMPGILQLRRVRDGSGGEILLNRHCVRPGLVMGCIILWSMRH
jgi:hypothetical protein